MKENGPTTAGTYADRGPRKLSTLDRAFDDPTPNLLSLRDLDANGEKCPTRIPFEDELSALWSLYAAKRDELSDRGARLNATDYFRTPRSARAARQDTPRIRFSNIGTISPLPRRGTASAKPYAGRLIPLPEGER